MKKKTAFQKAFKVFVSELKKDKDLYFGYQSNIASSFIDNGKSLNSRDSYKKLHEIGNAAAKEFLDQLINY